MKVDMLGHEQFVETLAARTFHLKDFYIFLRLSLKVQMVTRYTWTFANK